MTANGLSEKKNSILEINDLCFAYPEEKKRALNHVSLHVEDGNSLFFAERVDVERVHF